MTTAMTTTQSGWTWAKIVHGLMLAALLGGLPAVVGVILAFVKQGDFAGTPVEGHLTYAIRTFWICLLINVLSIPVWFIGLGWAFNMASAAFWYLRAGRAFYLALQQQPVPDPKALI